MILRDSSLNNIIQGKKYKKIAGELHSTPDAITNAKNTGNKTVKGKAARPVKNHKPSCIIGQKVPVEQ